VFLFVYGTIVVGVSDEYLRPVIVDRYANISPAVIVIGVLGGLSAFGVMGLFIGPIIVGALKASLEVFDEQYDAL
jgi:predicted PurR-regulated permease PerM